MFYSVCPRCSNEIYNYVLFQFPVTEASALSRRTLCVRVEIYAPAFRKLLAFYGELCRFLPEAGSTTC